MLQGNVHPDFANVAKTFSRILPRSGPGGAAVCAYHRGQCVVDIWGGTRDEAGSPWQADTVSLSYSTTKGVASTLIHVLVDRGLLDYDDPVSKYWPEFAQQGKGEITIRQLMCHEAGLYHIRSMIDDAQRMLDWDHMADALAASPTAHPPGASHGYHGLTYGWLLGELAQRATGKRFAALLASEIAEPLGLDGLYVGLPEDQLHRRARLVGMSRRLQDDDAYEKLRRRAKRLNGLLRRVGAPIDLARMASALVPPGMNRFDMNDETTVRAAIPAANGMFTARSLARLYAALACGGELDGVRLLSRETVERATQIQNRTMDQVVPVPMQWRLGYHRAFTMGIRLPRAFGHFGFGGSGAWADPDRELSCALVLNSGVGTPFGDARVARIGGAVARAASRR